MHNPFLKTRTEIRRNNFKKRIIQNVRKVKNKLMKGFIAGFEKV